MAIIGTDQDEENPNAPAAAGTPGTGGSANAAPPPSTGGAGGGFIGGGTGQGSTTAVKSPTAPTSSGNYTNLTNYLSANQGSGAAMGKTAENVVGQTGQQANQDLSSYQNSTNAAINAGTPTVNQGTLNQIKNGVTTGAATTTKNADGSTTTTGGKETYTGPTPAAVSYTGPTDPSKVSGQAATDQSSAYGDIASLVGGAPGSGTYNGGMVGQAAGGQTGVQSLLKNVYQQPSYTAGESGLDAFLTGGTPGGQASLKDIQTQWGGMGKKADDVNAGLYSNMIRGDGTAQNVNTTYKTAVQNAKNQAAAFNPASVTTTAAQTAKPAQPSGAPVAMPLATPAAATGPSSAVPSTASDLANKASGAGSPITMFTPDQLAAFAKGEANTIAGQVAKAQKAAPGLLQASGAPGTQGTSPLINEGVPQNPYQTIVNAVSNPAGAAQSAGGAVSDEAHKYGL